MRIVLLRSKKPVRLTTSAVAVIGCGALSLLGTGCTHSDDAGASPSAAAATAVAAGSGSPVRQAQAAQQSEMGKRQQMLMQQAQAHGAAHGQAPAAGK